MSFDELRAAVLALPAGDKLRLAEDLWGELEAADPCPLSPAQLDELDRRWRKHLADPALVIPGDEYLRRLGADDGL